MKKNLWMICLSMALCFSTQVFAQGEGKGISFEKEGTLFKEAVQKATATKKLIFLDCYTSWCGPCKKMAKDIFPLEEVGKFMNPAYVSIQIDMEKGEGPELMKKLQVSAFPTFIIFDSRGNELGRFLGGSDAATFVEKVKKASVDNSSAEMDQRFASGDRDEAFLYAYLKTLGSAYKRDQCNVVTEALLAGKEETFAENPQLADVFMKHLSNPFAPAFIYTVKHPEKLSAAIGETPVKMKTQYTWRNYAKSLIDSKDGGATMDMAQFDKLLALMDECKVAEKEEIRLETLIALSEKQADWDKYMQYCTEYDANPNLFLTDLMLCKWCSPVAVNCTEADPKQKALALLQKRIDDLKSGRLQPQTTQGNMKLSGNLMAGMEKLVEVLSK